MCLFEAVPCSFVKYSLKKQTLIHTSPLMYKTLCSVSSCLDPACRHQTSVRSSWPHRARPHPPPPPHPPPLCLQSCCSLRLSRPRSWRFPDAPRWPGCSELPWPPPPSLCSACSSPQRRRVRLQLRVSDFSSLGSGWGWWALLCPGQEAVTWLGAKWVFMSVEGTMNIWSSCKGCTVCDFYTKSTLHWCFLWESVNLTVWLPFLFILYQSGERIEFIGRFFTRFLVLFPLTLFLYLLRLTEWMQGLYPSIKLQPTVAPLIFSILCPEIQYQLCRVSEECQSESPETQTYTNEVLGCLLALSTVLFVVSVAVFVVWTNPTMHRLPSEEPPAPQQHVSFGCCTMGGLLG